MPDLRPLEGKFEVLRKLREGGMGSIYLVRHRLLGELRVVKVLRPQLQDEVEFRERFAREARVAIQLHHPNIAQLYDFAVDEEGAGYMVLEYVDGRTLQELVALGRMRALGVQVEVARQALDALGYLHRRGYVHRDVSPDNLMLGRDDDGRPVVKLIDLGIVKALHGEGGKTGTQVFLGKVRYASPEQFESSRVDARSDLYSFGVLFYELLTGRHPFLGENMHSMISGHMFKPPRPFSETDPEGRVPEPLRRLVFEALTKDPADRIASAAEFRRRLDAVVLPDDAAADWQATLVGAGSPEDPEDAGDTPSARAQRALDGRFGLERPTPAPTAADEPRLLARRAEAESRLDKAESLLAEGRLEEAAVLVRDRDAFADIPPEVAERRRKVQSRVGDRLMARKVGEWKALIEGEEEVAEPDDESDRTAHPSRRTRGVRVIAAAALSIALIVTFWFLNRPEPQAGAEEAARIPVASDPGPGAVAPLVAEIAAPPATALAGVGIPGWLRIDAAPWGEVVAVTGPGDSEVELPRRAVTPLRLRVPSGLYRVAVLDPRTGRRRETETQVPPDATGSAFLPLAPVDVGQYFASVGLAP